MKNLMVITVLLGGFSAFAGEIVNKNNGHYITLEYSRAEGIIDIVSSSTLDGRVIMVPSLDRIAQKVEGMERAKLMPITDKHFRHISSGDGSYDQSPFETICKKEDSLANCVFIDILNPLKGIYVWPATAATVLIDLVALPVRGIDRLFGRRTKEKKRAQEDLEILMKASFQDEKFEVESERFERIEEMLAKSVAI